MSLVRKIMALAAAVLFAAGLWVAPAHAAVTPGGGDGPGCYANGCDGQDPVAMGCWNDAYVASSSIIYYTVFDIGYVDNWYSPSCGTNWAQVFQQTTHGCTSTSVRTMQKSFGCRELMVALT